VSAPREISKNMNTPGERWCVDLSHKLYDGHFYRAGTDYARSVLGQGGGRKLLVVGAPLAEAFAHMRAGWDVLYADIRKPPGEIPYKCADICELPFANDSFDAVTTNCVLTHAGLGRYGDPIVANGDDLAIYQLYRVLKPGCTAVVQFGAVIDAAAPITWGITHRIYTVGRAMEMAKEAGFVVKDLSIWSNRLKRWLEDDELPSDNPNTHDYLSTTLVKPT